MSWDDGLLGARASRPHQAWHSLGHLPHLDQPGTAPWLSFGLADAVPADRVAACSIALKLSGVQRDRMRAGRPRSQADPGRGGSFESETTDYCGLSGARTLSGEAGWRQNMPVYPVHPCKSGIYRHARQPRPNCREHHFVTLSVTSCPFVDNRFNWFQISPGHRPPRRGGSFESETGFVSDKVEASGSTETHTRLSE